MLFFSVLAVFWVMAWNHERGFPKSVLVDDAKGRCVISKQAFVLRKSKRPGLYPELEAILPVPDGVDHDYSHYVPGLFLTEDGKDLVDISDAIEVPVGSRFILKDGFQQRTLNENAFYFWLEPEGISLDSSFFYYTSGLGFTDEEMHQFPDTEDFGNDCDAN
ncbi:MAG: hypothetical protein ABJH45_22285 [Paracoccaceae bacterium]